jgi:transposase-like protein
MSDMECPYCGADQEVCHDYGHGYSEDVKHEHECSECGKVFVFTTMISFDYTPAKADCLNGAEHELVFRKSWPSEHSRMGCKHCDYERTATPEEIAAHGITKGNT